MQKKKISLYSIDKIHITLYSTQFTTLNKQFIFKESTKKEFYKKTYKVYSMDGVLIGTLNCEHLKAKNHLLTINNSFLYSNPNWNNTITSLIKTLKVDTYRINEIHITKDSNFNYKLQFDKGYSTIRESYKDPIYLQNTKIIFDYEQMYLDEKQAKEDATLYLANGKKKTKKYSNVTRELVFYNKTKEIKSNNNYKSYVLDYYDNYHSNIIDTKKDVFRTEIKLSYNALQYNTYEYEIKSKHFLQVDILEPITPLEPIITAYKYKQLSLSDQEKYNKNKVNNYFNIELDHLNRQEYLEQLFFHFQPFKDEITKKIYKQELPEKLKTNKIKTIVMKAQSTPKINRKNNERMELLQLFAIAYKNIIDTLQDENISDTEKDIMLDVIEIQLKNHSNYSDKIFNLL